MLIASLNRLKGRFLCTLVSGCSCTVDPVVFGAAAENGGVRGHMIRADPDLRAVSADELSGEKELVHLCHLPGRLDTLTATGDFLGW